MLIQDQSERLVVVIDQFPYLVVADPSLTSILQRTWDRTLKNTRIMLILNGSYIGMMEETVLGYNAPLYGRRPAGDRIWQYPQNEIKQAAALDNTAPYLETLQQLHLVERIVPLTESQPHIPAVLVPLCSAQPLPIRARLKRSGVQYSNLSGSGRLHINCI